MSNLIINGMLSFAIAALSSVFFFENNGYGQRGRWVFILAAVIIGMFALSPIRQAWSRWRIRSLQAKIDRLKE
ncbi:MAG: hypothetical protein COA69_13470 [Robiginitomaculum sp.]|nr:MAG: hypothetical protein COA69_13470 [Robiginitomaculum sp.]